MPGFSENRTVLAVDVGGTFTDAVVRSPRGVFTGKTPTTPADQSEGVLIAAQQAIDAAGLQADAIDEFVHGMTVTTNAMLEGRFARTALLATAGFTDIEEIGRQNRADLYRLAARRPAAIVPPELRFAIAERCGPEGVIAALDETSARAAIDAALRAGAESFAVCLLFSFRYPDHELRVRELIREASPAAHVSLSHETVGTFREYERCATTTADAALAPLLSGYLARLVERAATAGLPRPQVMLSNGGTVDAGLAGDNASWTVLSGPAGGAVGAARAAERIGARRAIGFDMGGTSTDISLIEDGEVRVAASRSIGGRPVALPAVEIATVGAGGGSIGWRDDGGALRVGPRSAGARPGPACYGHGGTEPTVTDANLILGNLPSGSTLAGGLSLDRDAADRALARLGESLGLSAIDTARGIIEIANLEMLRATTSVTVARGVDPRDHTLIAFGGAGPMHAVAIAEALEIERVVCPAACGVLSAWGMSAAGRRRDRSRSIVRRLDELGAADVAATAAELASTSATELGLDREAASVELVHELRYAGQAFELPVTAEFDDLAEAFHATHERRFGFSDREAEVELVTLRVSVSAAAGDRTPDLAGNDDPVAEGPAVIEQAEATIVIPEGWCASARGDDIVLERISR